MTDQDQDVDIDKITRKVAERMDTGKVSDDRWLLSRRQLAAIAGSGLGAGALSALGISSAQAQTSGQVGAVGTSSQRVDLFAQDVDIGNGLTSSLPLAGNNIFNSGTTVYDGSTDTVGDGTTSANHQSLSTDELTLASQLIESIVQGDTTGLRVERGNARVTGASGASDNNTDTVSSNTQTITFDTAFSATPVVVNQNSPQKLEIVPILFNKTTTGFDVDAVNFTTQDKTSTGTSFDYIAVGPK
jgi:hypothetical protein